MAPYRGEQATPPEKPLQPLQWPIIEKLVSTIEEPLTPYQSKEVLSDPKARMFEGVLTKWECDYLIARAAPMLQRGGVTTGEWADALRAVFGEYRAPTGVAGGARAEPADGLEAARVSAARLAARLGRPSKWLLAKPGLDGHSNGAEQIALRARDCGIEVVYEGIRLSPAEIAAAALEEGVDLVGLSVLSGSHLTLVPEVMAGLKAQGLGALPLVVGGIIPPADAAALMSAGVARVYTPKDYRLSDIIADMVEVVAAGARAA